MSRLSHLYSDLPGLVVTERGRLTWLWYFGLPMAARYMRQNWAGRLQAIWHALMIALLLSYVGPAGATGVKPEPKPTPAPVTGTTNVQTSSTSAAEAAALAGANSSSASTATSGPNTSTATGQGGNGGQGGAATSVTGPVTVGGDTTGGSTSRSLGLVFPSLNFGSASASECLVAGPDGKAIGWNFAASTSPAVVEAKVCNLRALAREAASQCQWRTAAELRRAAAAEIGVKLPEVPTNVVDADPMSCVIKPAEPAPMVVVGAPTAAAVAGVTDNSKVENPPAPPRAPARPPKQKPQEPVCPSAQQQIQQCVPKGNGVTR